MNIELSSLNINDFKLYLIIVVSIIIINIIINVSLYYKLKNKIYFHLSYLISLSIALIAFIVYLSMIHNYDKVRVNGEYEVDNKFTMMQVEGEYGHRDKVYLKNNTNEYLSIVLKQQDKAKIGDKVIIKMNDYRLIKKDRFEILLNGKEGQLDLNYKIRKSGN